MTFTFAQSRARTQLTHLPSPQSDEPENYVSRRVCRTGALHYTQLRFRNWNFAALSGPDGSRPLPTAHTPFAAFRVVVVFSSVVKQLGERLLTKSIHLLLGIDL